jgi:hypothetical protein
VSLSCIWSEKKNRLSYILLSPRERWKEFLIPELFIPGQISNFWLSRDGVGFSVSHEKFHIAAIIPVKISSHKLVEKKLLY